VTLAIHSTADGLPLRSAGSDLAAYLNAMVFINDESLTDIAELNYSRLRRAQLAAASESRTQNGLGVGLILKSKV
jgi:hypothetical protein